MFPYGQGQGPKLTRKQAVAALIAGFLGMWGGGMLVVWSVYADADPGWTFIGVGVFLMFFGVTNLVQHRDR